MTNEFDPTLYGEDFFEQMDNFQFTDAERTILNIAISMDDDEFGDEEYIELAYHFASTNGLNNR